MKNMLNESNPLKSGPGKGSAARNLSKKFRKNYDDIKWVESVPETKTNFKRRKK